MTTGILVTLTIVLVLAAVFVGVLLLRRRSRPAPPVDQEGPQTVGELVRSRTSPDDLGGDELFAPSEPRRSAGGAAGATRVDAPREPDTDAEARTVEVPVPAPGVMTPPTGEAGDAPWRRAARMRGEEPGSGWDTAPIPVVAPVAAVASVASVATKEPAAGTPVAVVAAPVPAAADREPAVPEQATQPVRSEPARAAVPRPTPTRRTAEPVPASVWTLPEAVDAEKDTAAGAESDAAGPSRPLSDPEMTPLMGIPIVRPLTAESAAAPTAAAPVAPVAPVAPRPSPAPPVDLDDEDEVVSLLPATGVTPPPVVRSGSPQPVWFRVVRRDGDPVAGVVVALLDDHGQEVDATKTATDGGGELGTPHGGRFLMIASADGFQPRAALLTVDEQPVELALLLPRSARIAGTVRSDERLVTGGRVVARQEGEVVDDLVTGRDGAYRFDDLAEGTYVLSATDHRGSVVRQVAVTEGAELDVDLDLVYRDGAR